MKIRTRYAPSPTGQLHIGGARTALFCYLFAKHNNGDFVIRIEDTDIKRNIVNGEDSQIDNLEWLGIFSDESPRNPNDKYGKYRQSEKLNRYNLVINELIKNGHAYKAYDNSRELEKQREEQEKTGIFSFRYDKNWLNISEEELKHRDQNNLFSIRLALPKNKEYKWKDMVRGNIIVNTNDIGDFIIRKQDGFPTYNFAVVIDDYDMEISHVFRGEEHITNTPKQLVIYDIMGWEAPTFAHLTIITNMEGKKLSKRDLETKQFIEDYKNEGYLPQAILNFLALLGWTSEDKVEINSKNELIKKFDWKRLSKSPSKFDIRKMEWFSKQYFKNSSNNELITKLVNTNFSDEWLELFVDTYKQNAITIKQINESLIVYENKEIKKPEDNIVLKTFSKFLEQEEFTIKGIENAIEKTKDSINIRGKELFMPIRLGATYQQHGPELAKAIFLFGEELIRERLKYE